MTTQDTLTSLAPAASAGRPGEQCPSCGAALAADQRYCLECGERRGEPRVAFLDLLGRRDAPPAAEPASTVPAPPGVAERPLTPWVAAAGVAVLLLVLGVGILIGDARSGGDRPVASKTPVITVNAGASGPAAATGAAKPAAAGRHQKAPKASKASAKTGGVGTRASTQQLQQLQSSNPKDYAKKSAKLPKTVVTPGNLPPKDTKAPGAGSGVETIK
jgi:hypothetical protein